MIKKLQVPRQIQNKSRTLINNPADAHEGGMGLGEPEAVADGPRPQACHPLQFLAARSFADFTDCKVHPVYSTGYRSKVLVSFPQASATVSVMCVGPTRIASCCINAASNASHDRPASASEHHSMAGTIIASLGPPTMTQSNASASTAACGLWDGAAFSGGFWPFVFVTILIAFVTILIAFATILIAFVTILIAFRPLKWALGYNDNSSLTAYYR
jgi:hypothetical protein